MKSSIRQHLKRVKQTTRKLVNLTDDQIQEILLTVSNQLIEKTPEILEANQLDLERMNPEDPKYDRLLLSPERIASIATDIQKVAALPTPLGQVLEEKNLPNGLHLRRMVVPIGVIGIIYESRPNVTLDVFSICLKTGNACVLKGSKDAQDSNTYLVQLIQDVLESYDLKDAIWLAPSEREALSYLLEADGLIDCIIPRGSQGLIEFVRKNATVPVIETGAGIVHVYVDQSADLTQARAIIANSKTRRVSVCNALDCLIIHQSLLSALPKLVAALDTTNQVKIHADHLSFAALDGHYKADLLVPASPEDFGVEWLSHQLTIKTVDSLDEALEHIDAYSSRHSECIVAQDDAVTNRFLKEVDAACVYANASTAFSDGGEFGMGAEIGISTQKLHARGPMGLREMTSYKWIVVGQGQVRK